MTFNMHENFIAGKGIEGADAALNINPSDKREVVGQYAHADAAQAELAIDAALKKALDLANC